MNYLDIILWIFLLIGLVKGFMNGFIIEVASLVALIAGIFGAIYFSHYAIDLLDEHVDWSDNTINLVAFAVTFILIVLLVMLLGRLLTKVAKTIMLGTLNKLLGALFGLLKVGFILSVIIMFLAAFNDKAGVVEEEVIEESQLYPFVQPLAPMFLPDILKEAGELREGVQRA
ncbi:MAG: CvpA family protein [Leeuwenhoekiella sp.]